MPVSPPDASSPAPSEAAPGYDAPREDRWLTEFHAGDRSCLERCYRDHLPTVERVVAAIVAGADRETLVHEVFYRLLTDETLRRGFRGGSFPSWLRVVARNQAIDYARRRQLEIKILDQVSAPTEPLPASALDQEIDVRLTLTRFQDRVLPPKWRPVFVARFIEHQDQPTAARALGMRRTTLAYQEYRIRKLLHRYVLRGETP